MGGYIREKEIENMAEIKVTPCEIEGLYVIEPKVFGDERGYFMETYNRKEFEAKGLTMEFVQDNESMSKKGVLRGLHFQKNFPQGKLVRVLSGEVFDVAVDIRKGSPTFGKWFGVVLSDENKKFPRDLLTGIWCYQNRQFFLINVLIFTIQRTKEGSGMTIRRSALTGPSARICRLSCRKRTSIMRGWQTSLPCLIIIS